MAHNIAHNRADNFPSYPLDNHHYFDVVYLREGGSFFLIVDTCLSCEDIARQSCGMVQRWRLFGDSLRPLFAASRAQHVSDLHSKFTLRPYHVWKYGRHPISDR